MKTNVWSLYRKLMSNLVPACVFVPLFAAGLMFYQRGWTWPALLCFALTPVAGWFAVNYLGLFANRQMMQELSHAKSENSIFVGFARPGSIGILDAHEDVGWLTVLPDKIQFAGERHKAEMLRNEIIGIRTRPNVHSILGLGRWVSIEGKRDGREIRMMVEPRQESSLIANKRLGNRMLTQLRAWQKGS